MVKHKFLARHIILVFSMMLVVACINQKDERNSVYRASDSEADTATSLQVTVLTDLPDSLVPKTTYLDTMPKPRTVVIPTSGEGFYHYETSDGRIIKAVTKPTVNRFLPVLQNAEGEAVKDNNGNPFILGDGGISDFTTFTTHDGLALDAVFCSIMDRTGNLWFGTYGGGVSRYDGKSFTTFSTAQGLAGPIVYCMAEDKSGNLWFGTEGYGVSRYDGKSFTTFSTEQGLAGPIVTSIAEDSKGNLWFGTMGNGVSCYNGKSFTTFSTKQGLVNNDVRSIAEDQNGNLWFGTYYLGASRYDGKSFVSFSPSSEEGGGSVLTIAKDKANNLWFGSYSGASRYDGKSFTTHSNADGLAGNEVRVIARDKSGNLWIGTNGNGVSRYDGKSFTTYTTAQGLAGNNVRSITEDKSGNLWFGTYGGVSRYNGKAYTTFSTAQGLPNNRVLSITEDKAGNLWFATNAGGVNRYDGKSITLYTSHNGLAGTNIISTAEDKNGILWFGSAGGGLSRYDGKSFITFFKKQGLPDDVILCICQDKTGNLWFGTEAGVSKHDGKSFTNFSIGQGLAGPIVNCMAEDKAGHLWFGTEGHGVSRYDGKSFATFSTANGLAGNTVLSIANDNEGNLWFGTNNGLCVLPVNQGNWLEEKIGSGRSAPIRSIPLFKTFTKADGLPDNVVTQILQLPNGRMAVGTIFGITMFTPSEDLSSLDNVEEYNSRRGYPIKDINAGHNSMYLDSKGTIWAGTGSARTALVHFDPSALRVSKEPPTLIIRSIKIDEKDVCWSDLSSAQNISRDTSLSTNPNLTEEATTFGRVLSDEERDKMREEFKGISFDGLTHFYPIPQHLTLPYDHNQISFDFAAIETGKPNLVNYQYTLEGYDRGWSPVGKNTTAGFGNIREGNYTFKVKAQGPNGLWSIPLSYSFKVLPPWYRTWWAYLTYALLLLGALRTFAKWRERNLRSDKAKLEQKVKERTAVIELERQRSDELLLNILPAEVAAELKSTGGAKAKQFDDVTVLFTDFVNFTNAGERMSPQQLIDELHTFFKAFDEITARYNIEKIKTIGDAYLAVAGLPAADPNHAINMIHAAQEIIAFTKARISSLGNATFQIRVGINSGTVVAGIVGVKKFAYDIWGDTVNTAARMEQNSEAGKINISQTTYECVKDQIRCTYRGEIEAKHKGQLKMYFVEDMS